MSKKRRSAGMRTGKVKRRFSGKIIYIALLLVLVFATLWYGAPYYIERKISNSITGNLTELFQTPVTISNIDIDPSHRRLCLYGLRIAQPEGFGAGDMLYLPETRVIFAWQGVFSGKFKLDRLTVTDAGLDIRTNTNAVSNLERVMAGVTKNDKGYASQKNSGYQSLSIKSLNFTNCAVLYHEQTSSALPVVFNLSELSISASNLMFVAHDTDIAASPAILEATARIPNPPYPGARCGLIAEFGEIGPTPPWLNAALEITGYELLLISPLLPPNTAALLGGDALDGSVRIKAGPPFLDGRITVNMIAGHSYSVNIAGVFDKPELSIKDEVLASVLARSRGALGDTINRIGSAGGSALKGAAKVATGLAGGAAKTVGSFGSGAFETVKGAVTFDKSEMTKGVKEMGSAVSGGARDAVFTAGGGIMEGAGEIGGSLTGSNKSMKWRGEIDERWSANWQKAKQWVRMQPFPPEADTTHGTESEDENNQAESGSRKQIMDTE